MHSGNCKAEKVKCARGPSILKYSNPAPILALTCGAGDKGAGGAGCMRGACSGYVHGRGSRGLEAWVWEHGIRYAEGSYVTVFVIPVIYHFLFPSVVCLS